MRRSGFRGLRGEESQGQRASSAGAEHPGHRPRPPQAQSIPCGRPCDCPARGLGGICSDGRRWPSITAGPGVTPFGAGGGGDRRDRGVESARLAGPVVPGALVAMDAAAFPGVCLVDVRGHVARARVDVPGGECLVRGPAADRLVPTAGMLRNLSVARPERLRLANLSSGGGTAPFACCLADALEVAVSPAGAHRTRLSTILGVLLGRPAGCPDRALRCLVGLPCSNEGEVD